MLYAEIDKKAIEEKTQSASHVGQPVAEFEIAGRDAAGAQCIESRLLRDVAGGIVHVAQ